VRWYRKAADQGDADAQNNLGAMYGNGEGVAKDDAEAVKWFRKAADQGNASAQLNLGMRYDNGWGVAENDRCDGTGRPPIRATPTRKTISV
jgi:hypothetical protein